MGEKRDYLRTYHSHRYAAKPFRNPFARQKKSKLRPKQILLICVAGLSVAGLTYLFGFAPFWNITGIHIDGLQFISSADMTDIANADLAKHRYLIFPERNRLFFDANALAKDLSAKFSFEELTVTVEHRVVMIRVKERLSQVLWMTNKAPYYLDVNGTVIRPLPQTDADALVWHGSDQPLLNGKPMEGPFPAVALLNSLPLIVDQDEKPVMPGDQVLSPKSIAAIIAMNDKMHTHGFPVRQIIVERKDSIWARLVTQEGFDVLFDTTADPDAQISYLMDVLTKSVSDRSKLDYVDVRFGNHVYFKTR